MRGLTKKTKRNKPKNKIKTPPLKLKESCIPKDTKKIIDKRFLRPETLFEISRLYGNMEIAKPPINAPTAISKFKNKETKINKKQLPIESRKKTRT
jgi:hypothetical protein